MMKMVLIMLLLLSVDIKIISGDNENVIDVDKIRNLNIGYIFQDYKLIDNLEDLDDVLEVFHNWDE